MLIIDRDRPMVYLTRWVQHYIMIWVKFLTPANQKHWIWSCGESGLCNPRPRLLGGEVVVGSSSGKCIHVMALENKLQDKTKKKINCKEKWHSVGKMTFSRSKRSPANSPHKGQWRGALMFYLICAWTNGWINNRDARGLRRHRAHYDVTVMVGWIFNTKQTHHTSNLWVRYGPSFLGIWRKIITK